MTSLNSMRGDSRICIAILDSDVDMQHPALKDTTLQRLLIPGLVPSNNKNHGTYVASIIFSDTEDIRGIAPACRGIYIPVYTDTAKGLTCDQDKLAEGIMIAARAGAHIINISGGVITPDNSSSLPLAEAVRYCADHNIQVVAAVGNEGCDCLHVPASLPGVLAVGGLDASGEPYPFNNFGHIYRQQGLLVSLDGVKGAVPGAGTMHKAASSYAAPVASGTLALLCAAQVQAQQAVNATEAKQALLETSSPCPKSTDEACKRFLAGIMQADAAYHLLQERWPQRSTAPSGIPLDRPTYSTPPASFAAPVTPSGCCPDPTPVYALGEIGFTFPSESVKRSVEDDLGSSTNTAAFLQAMRSPAPQFGAPPDRLYYADTLLWTLSINTVPAYVIRPEGLYAREAYQQLIRCMLTNQPQSSYPVRCALSGIASGTMQLLNGMELPVVTPAGNGITIQPVAALLTRLIGRIPTAKAGSRKLLQHHAKTNHLLNTIEHLHTITANNGLLAKERAINYALQQAIVTRTIFSATYTRNLSLHSIEAVPALHTPPGMTCFDVQLTFINPSDKMGEAATVFSFTVDVSHTTPVLTGSIKTWNTLL